jgi:hypothetical protein
MKRIGLIGESPNDTNSFINLFSRQYPGLCEYFPLLKNYRGGNLDNVKLSSPVVAQLKTDYRFMQPDFVILIRDADALESDHVKMNDRLTKLYALGNAVTQNATYLFCIWEMETLLLADMDTVNAKFKTFLTYPYQANDPVDPMLKADPKQFLIDNCGYNTSDCSELFKTIDFNKLLSVRFFSEFVTNFEKRIK